MEMSSNLIHGDCFNLSDLFQLDGSIRKIIAIAAYVDIESLNQLLDFLEINADSRVYPHLSIFTDKASSRFMSNRQSRMELLKVDERIKSMCDSTSGIFLVQLGSLFHSKAYLVEGNKKSRLLFGSMNLTQKAINSNEELIVYDDFNIEGNSKFNFLAKWIKDYVNRLYEKSYKLGHELSGCYLSNMREILLNGNIWYELNEQNPFRLRLQLPEEFSRQQAHIDPLLEYIINDSVSIEALITSDEPEGLGVKLPEHGSSRSSWKKYCIETCFGYWNPIIWEEDLLNVLDKRTEDRRPYFDKIIKILRENEEDLRECFLRLCLRIKDYLDHDQKKEWKLGSSQYAEQAWERWHENITKKIYNNEFYDRLVCGVFSVPAPDVWNDPFASIEFESSFYDAILYHWSKENSKVSYNVIAQAIAWNLDIDPVEKLKFDNERLKDEVYKWINENPDKSIFQFNEDIVKI